jgi:hypothetical protein
LGTVPLGNDAHHAACRNRLVRQHVAEHRPAGVVHDFAIPVSLPASSGSRLRRRTPCNAARDRATSHGGNADAGWQFSPPAPLREPSAAPLEHSELFLLLPVERHSVSRLVSASPNTGARYSMQRHWSGWRGTLGKSSPKWIVGCWPATETLITVISSSSTRRSCRFRCWSTPSRGTSSRMPTARHRLSLSRRCFVVAGLFRCVGRRRSDHQAVCRATEAARFLPRKFGDEATRSSVWPIPATNSLLKFSRPQKSGLSARGTSASFPEYH